MASIAETNTEKVVHVYRVGTWVGRCSLVGQGKGNCIACHIIVGVFPIKIHVGTALAAIPSRINISAPCIYATTGWPGSKFSKQILTSPKQ